MLHLLLVAMLARFDNLLFELGRVVSAFSLNGGYAKNYKNSYSSAKQLELHFNV